MTTLQRLHTAGLLALLAASSSAPGAAQVPGLTAGAGAYLEAYSFSDPDAAGFEEVRLLTVPFGASLQPVSWATVTLSGAFASGTAVQAGGEESHLSGLTDTSVRLEVPVVPGRFTVGAALLLPTGVSAYSEEKGRVAGIIAADLLPFRISSWGAGGAVDLRTSVAAPLGSFNVAGTVGYQAAREFDLVEGEDFTYQPGNQLYLGLTADRPMGDSRLALQLTVYRYGDDLVNSQNLYQSGDRMHGILSYVTPMGRRGRAQLYGGALHRQNGVFLDGSPDSPSQTLFLMGGGLRQPFRYGVLAPAVDVRLLRSQDGVGQGYIAGAGLSADLPLAGGAATFIPTARVRFGNVLAREDLESGVTGFELGGAIRFGR